MSNIEQRQHARYPANLTIRVGEVGAPVNRHQPGRMVDVSQEGMCFVFPRYLAPGTAVQIEFERCKLLGEVRHCRLREYGTRMQFFTGVQIAQVLEGEESWQVLMQAPV